MRKEVKRKICNRSEVISEEQVYEDTETEKGPWKAELLDALAKMPPQKFEIFSRGLLINIGVDLDDNTGIRYVGDDGLDDFRTARIALQAKRWDGKVSAPEIDKNNAKYGIFITMSDFSCEAMKIAKVGIRIITLINGDKICDLVAKYHYYVEPVTTYKEEFFQMMSR